MGTSGFATEIARESGVCTSAIGKAIKKWERGAKSEHFQQRPNPQPRNTPEITGERRKVHELSLEILGF